MPRTFLHFGGIIRSRTPQFTYRFWNNRYKIERKGQGGVSGFISLGSARRDDSWGSPLRAHGMCSRL